jgi:hypothetical protein
MTHPPAAGAFARISSVALLLVGTWLACGSAHALELHSFVDAECHVHTGVLVRVDDTQAQLITMQGSHASVPIDSVRVLAIHKVLENPLPQMTIDDPLRALAREVRTGNAPSAGFVGWPVGFYDQLVIFFDTDGRSHVLEPQDIRSMRAVRVLAPSLRPPTSAPAPLDFPPELFLCPLPRAENGLRPSRVLGDGIKIQDYLAKLRDRYSALDGFEERTHVYPRPLVFDPSTRLGLSYFRGQNGSVIKYMPLYFSWSSGRPYRFQSHSAIGVVVSPWLPVVAPTLSFQSDVKSHFFTATFVGHLASLPAGSSAFDAEEQLLPQGSTPAVDELYNYLVLMGGDWGPFSVSGGAMYRDLRIAFSKQDRREVVAETMSPVARLMWIGLRTRLRAMYFRTRQDRSGGEGWFPLPRTRGESSSPVSYRLALDTLRAGIDLDLPYDLSLSADQVLTLGQYRETGTATMDIVHALSSLVLTAQFSRYVAVKGYLNLEHRRYDIAPDPAAPSLTSGLTTRTNTHLGGALEFLF